MRTSESRRDRFGGRIRRFTVPTVVAALVLSALPVLVAAPAQAAAGHPGTPNGPVPLYTEDFSAQNASSAAIDIGKYTGTPGTNYSPGVSGASSETYTADPNWQASAKLCNGFIVNSMTPGGSGAAAGDPCAGSAAGMANIGTLAKYIGQFQGMGTASAAQNQALVSWTWTTPNPGPGVQFQTKNPIPAVDGHFYRVTSIFGEANCGVGDAQERLSLIVNGTLQTLASNLDPCNAQGAISYVPPIQNANLPTKVASLASPAFHVTAANGAPTLGMQLYNATGTGSGNDVVFDLPQIMDVTPQLDKSFTPATVTLGQTSTLVYTITNTNELGAKNGWSFHDNLPDGMTATGVNSTTCSSGAVTAGAGATTVGVTGNLNLNQGSCQVRVQVTANNVGSYTNGAGNFPDGVAGLNGLLAPNDAVLNVAAPATISLVKSSSTTAITTVGQLVTYKFLVTNKSQVTLNNLTVADTQTPPASQGNLSAISCPKTSLAPGDTTTCLATYTVTQADLDNGSLADTATASAKNPTGGTVTSPPSALTIGTPAPAISVTKKSSTTRANAVGQQIPYTFTVTNTGNVQLFNVGVTDTQIAPASQANMSAVTCPQPSLAPSASEDCTGTYTVTQADLQNGSINDSAVSTGTTGYGVDVASDPSALTIPATLPGALTIVKSSSVANITGVGQVVPYTFQVTNNSAVTVNNITVTDTVSAPSLPSNLSAVSCPVTVLAAGASTICTANYTVTSADVNQGAVSDSAHADGTDPSGNPVHSLPSSLTLQIPTSSITIVKATTVNNASAVGQQIPFTFVVTNTGNTTLTSLTVVDTQVAPSLPANMSAITCPVTTLPAGQSTTCSGTYTVTAADIGNGSINDYAAAQANDPSNNQVTSPQSAASVPVQVQPLTMVKASSDDFFDTIGQLVRYSFTVTNTSEVTYTNIQIQDTPQAPATSANLGGIICPDSTLQPGDSMTCTVTYRASAADIANGNVINVATATGVDPGGATARTAQSSVIIPSHQSPAISLSKTSTTQIIHAVGQQVPYTFTVTNTGNVPVQNVTVVDTQVPPASQANMSAVTCPTGPVAAGASVVCTGTYTTVAADLNQGWTTDNAVAHAATAQGANVDSNQATLTITANPALSIVKSSTTSQITTIGQQVPYSFLVTNVTGARVDNLSVTDQQIAPASQAALSPIICPVTSLTAGQSTTCTATYTVTAADVANGKVDDTATASGTNPLGRRLPPSAPSSLSIPVVQQPALSIAKTSNTSVITSVGQVVRYSFTVTNTGNVQMTNIAVNDTQTPPATQANLTGLACPTTTLDAGQSMVCTAQYTVTQADLNNHSVADTATVSGTAPDGSSATSAPSSLSIPAPATRPALTIVKSADTTSIDTINQQVTYSFLVTNTGTNPLTNVTVTDTQAAPGVQGNLSAVTCATLTNPSNVCSGTSTSLAVGQSAVFRATYTVTQPDLDHGSTSDTATAHGVSGGTAVNSSPSALTIPADPIQNQVSIQKTSTTTVVTAVGQQVPYTFTVTNNGTQTLTGVAVDDTVQAPSVQSRLSAVTCARTTLLPGASTTCSATYTATQADLNNGFLADSAAAHGTTPTRAVVNSNLANLQIPVTRASSMSIVKATTTTQVTAVGQQVPYTFTVTNTGNQSLSAVHVSDALTAPSDPANLSAITCPTTDLNAGEQVVCTATYTVSQADIDHGGTIADQASVTATDTLGGTISAGPSPKAVPIVQTSGITVAKGSTTAQITVAGQQVPYSFTVTNTGNTTVSNISISDTVAPPSDPANLTPVVCPTTTLRSGQQVVCTATYSVTQVDIDHGGVVGDQATAAATDPNGKPLQATSGWTIPVAQAPSMTVAKTSTTTAITAAGQQVPYRFTVTNTGNVTLTNVAVTDTVSAPSDPANLTPVNCPAGPLAPGGVMVCTATYTTTQKDVDHGGFVADSATAAGTAPDGTVIHPASPSDLSIPVTQNPTLTVVKSSPDVATPITHVGQTIRYQFVVTNTGNVTLATVGITDRPVAPADPANLSTITCPQTTLAPGEQTICTASYTVAQPDLDHGDVTNSATAHAEPPSGPQITSQPSTVSVPGKETPHLTVVKATTTALITAVGQQIPYTFTVTNTGNVTMKNIAVTDTVASPSNPANSSPVVCPTTTLVPGQSTVCSATYTATQADIDNGTVNDTAAVSGTDPNGTSKPGDSTSSVSIPTEQKPGLDIVKATTFGPVTAAGQQIPYTFTVTNTGNVTLKSVHVTDTVASPSDPANLSPISCPQGDLTVGGVFVCTATYTTTQADVNNGSVNDTADAAATAPDGTTVHPKNTSSVSVPVDQTHGLTVKKTSTVTTISKVGQQVPYTFTVTNTGNTTITGVKVTDTVADPSNPANLTAVQCPTTSVDPGEHVDCTATYTVTQADIDHGTVGDQATVTGKDPKGNTVDGDGPSALTIPVGHTSGLTVVKKTTTTMVTAVGQQVPYTFTVTNTGNTTLTGVAVNDTVAAPSDPSHVSQITCVKVTDPDASCSGTTVTLAPGQVATFVATYTAGQPDLNVGSVTDTAGATGTDPNGTTIMSKNPSTVTIPAVAAHMPTVSG